MAAGLAGWLALRPSALFRSLFLKTSYLKDVCVLFVLFLSMRTEWRRIFEKDGF